MAHLPYIPVDVLLHMVPTFFDVLEIYTTISPVCKAWCFHSLHLARESAILAFLEDWPQVPRRAIDMLPHDLVSELRRYMRVHVALLQPQKALWQFPEGWCEQMAQDTLYRKDGVVDLVCFNQATPTGTLLSPSLTREWLECLISSHANISIPTTLLSNVRKHVEAQEKQEFYVYATTWAWLKRMYQWMLYVHPQSQSYVSLSSLARNPISITFDYVFLQLVRGMLKHSRMTQHLGMYGIISSIYHASWGDIHDPREEGWMWAQEIHMLADWSLKTGLAPPHDGALRNV